MLEMKVKAVVMDQSGGNFSVLLTDMEEKKVLPIAIGAMEAHCIALPLQGEVPPRPLTHDLLLSVLQRFTGKVEKIVITGIRESTYYAEIHVKHLDKYIVFDSRPTDAIALALRCNAYIYIAPVLVEFTYNLEDTVFFSDEGDQEKH